MDELTTTNGNSAQALPSLALSWTQTSTTTWNFVLRTGVTFQDGEPFNAAAVVNTVQKVVPQASVNFGDYLAGVKAAREISPYVVEIDTNGDQPSLPTALTFMPIVAPNHSSNSDQATDPIGTGPYSFVSSTPSQVTLKRNPSYWGSRPYYDTATVVSMPQASQRVAALQAGEVQLAYDIPTQNAKQVPVILSAPIATTDTMILNPFGGLTADPRIRQAIILATDNEQIRSAIAGNTASAPATCQFVKPGTIGFDPALKAQPVDAAKARQLVQAAGDVGKTIVLVASANFGLDATDVSQAYASQIEKATGLKVTVKLVEMQAWLTAATTQPAAARPEILYTAVSYESESALQPYGNYIPDAAGKGPIPAYQTSNDPSIVGLLATATSGASDAARTAAFDTIAQRFCDANVADFLFSQSESYGLQKGISYPPRQDEILLLSTLSKG